MNWTRGLFRQTLERKVIYTKEIKVLTKEKEIYLQKVLVLEGLIMNFDMCYLLLRQNRCLSSIDLKEYIDSC